MKHLSTGVAIVAVLAFVAPIWAQTANPSGGNAQGLPGPNPGGPGLTPYSSGPRTGAPPSSASPPAMAPSAPSSMSDARSAMPPKHRPSGHTSHGKVAGQYRGKEPQLTGSTANQLNQEELSRLQSGNFSAPPDLGTATGGAFGTGGGFGRGTVPPP
jgi:hypothetical protein